MKILVIIRYHTSHTHPSIYFLIYFIIMMVIVIMMVKMMMMMMMIKISKIVTIAMTWPIADRLITCVVIMIKVIGKCSKFNLYTSKLDWYVDIILRPCYRLLVEDQKAPWSWPIRRSKSGVMTSFSERHHLSQTNSDIIVHCMPRSSTDQVNDRVVF